MEHKHQPPIENSIKQQLEANRSKNLLYENVEQIMEIDPGFLAALEELLNATRGNNQPENIPSEVVSFAAQALLKRLYAVNQYLNIGDEQGVLQDGELLVSRNGKLVAKVIVRTVEKDRSVANIVPGWKLGDVFEGDQVTPAHPAS